MQWQTREFGRLGRGRAKMTPPEGFSVPSHDNLDGNFSLLFYLQKLHYAAVLVAGFGWVLYFRANFCLRDSPVTIPDFPVAHCEAHGDTYSRSNVSVRLRVCVNVRLRAKSALPPLQKKVGRV